MADFECEICNKTFAFKQWLKSHVEEVHQRKEEVDCKICGKLFSNQGNLNVHIASVHNGKVEASTNVQKSRIFESNCPGFELKVVPFHPRISSG